MVCVLCALTTSNSSITGNAATAGDGGGVALTGNSSTCSVTGSALTLNAVSRGRSPRGRAVSAGRYQHNDTEPHAHRVQCSDDGKRRVQQSGNRHRDEQLVGVQFRSRRRRSGLRGHAQRRGRDGGGESVSRVEVEHLSDLAAAGASSTMTADVTFNSSSADTSFGGTIPNGTDMTFSATLGTFASPSSTTTSGKATGLYTASRPGHREPQRVAGWTDCVVVAPHRECLADTARFRRKWDGRSRGVSAIDPRVARTQRSAGAVRASGRHAGGRRLRR